MSTKLWGFSCFLSWNMFGLLVVYFIHLTPHVHFSCLVHALHICTFCTHLVNHAMFYFMLLHHFDLLASLACHVFFILCSILFLRCFLFCLSFIFHSPCLSYASLSFFLSCFLSHIFLGSFIYL